MRTTVIATLLCVALAGPALAMRCPTEMSKIDEALQSNADLSEAELQEVQDLRAEGERLHDADQHAESVAALDQAKRILGIE